MKYVDEVLSVAGLPELVEVKVNVVSPRVPVYVVVAVLLVTVNVIDILELLTLPAENELTFRKIDVLWLVAVVGVELNCVDAAAVDAEPDAPWVNPPSIVTSVAARTTVMAMSNMVAIIGETALSSFVIICFIMNYNILRYLTFYLCV